jgi:hypothetical protein
VMGSGHTSWQVKESGLVSSPIYQSWGRPPALRRAGSDARRSPGAGALRRLKRFRNSASWSGRGTRRLLAAGTGSGTSVWPLPLLNTAGGFITGRSTRSTGSRALRTAVLFDPTPQRGIVVRVPRTGTRTARRRSVLVGASVQKSLEMRAFRCGWVRSASLRRMRPVVRVRRGLSQKNMD